MPVICCIVVFLFSFHRVFVSVFKLTVCFANVCRRDLLVRTGEKGASVALIKTQICICNLDCVEIPDWLDEDEDAHVWEDNWDDDNIDDDFSNQLR